MLNSNTRLDSVLGTKIHTHLTKLGLETPTTAHYPYNEEQRNNLLKNSFTSILNALGMDLRDDSLKETPMRMAKMFGKEIFYGLDYANFPKCTVIENKMGTQEMVLVKNISVNSLCEHHLVPFIGKAHIAYIPRDKIIGLSKFNRITDFFARRPQVQERLTEQISAALTVILKTSNVAVYIEAEHMCVKIRGVKDSNSSTITSRVRGKFFTEASLRSEFLTAIRGF